MARRVLHESAARGEFATGLIYVEPGRARLPRRCSNVVDEPLAVAARRSETRPPREALEAIMEGLR